MWSQLDSERRVQSPSPLDKVIQEYQGKAEFLFVYGRETAPEPDGPLEIKDSNFRKLIREFADLPPLVQTRTWEERAKRAALFAQKTKTLCHILVDDDGKDSVSQRYQAGHLLTVVVDLQGRIALRGTNVAAQQLRDFLSDCLVSQLRSRIADFGRIDDAACMSSTLFWRF
jgi:hypothetical protein